VTALSLRQTKRDQVGPQDKRTVSGGRDMVGEATWKMATWKMGDGRAERSDGVRLGTAKVEVVGKTYDSGRTPEFARETVG
jgi:hypothetical protein